MQGVTKGGRRIHRGGVIQVELNFDDGEGSGDLRGIEDWDETKRSVVNRGGLCDISNEK